MKKIRIGTAASLMALTAAVTFVVTFSFSRKLFNEKVRDIDGIAEKYERLDELDRKVRAEYYKDIPEDDVTTGILMGYVAGLGDPYSAYRPTEQLTDYQENNAGVYTGIGISIVKNDEGYALIVEVAENGSAQKAGIAAGDVLTEVEDISLKGDYKKAIDMIAGEVGTYVRIRIRKENSEKETEYTLKREQLDETTVYSEMLDGQIGYIRITKFRSVSVGQFADARKKLLDDGAKGFVFDVRDNGGGVLSALEKMVDPILPEGELAFSYDRAGNPTTILKSDKECMKMPYVVLVNGATASASELFACVLRDYSDAKLVGETTFGKGIMQTTFELTGGGVTLTTATYATGKTPCYHETGLEPDVQIVYDPEAEQDNQLEAAQQTVAEMILQDAA
ncbi:MAG: PDZ domain-containing protein [Oscillospiraceae bacterium]|nr:PDZ domain-containing protein [Oscillospiraceae bacterium]